MEKLIIINEAKEQLKTIVDDLEIVTKAIAHEILKNHVAICKFVQIPELTMEDEKHRILHGQPKQIEVRNLPINDGLNDFVKRFHYFYTTYGMSTRFSPNFPGVICMTNYSTDLENLVFEANALKLQFSSTIKVMSEKLKKHFNHESLDQLIFDVIHGPMPMVLTECITRKIQLLNSPIVSASFSMRTNIKKNLISRDDLLDKLTNQFNKASKDGERQLCEHLHNEISAVKKTSFAVFGYPRYTTPTPTLTVKTLESSKVLNYRACLPLIVQNQAELIPTIYDMASYDAEKREKRKKRNTEKLGMLVYSHSGLYGYEQ